MSTINIEETARQQWRRKRRKPLMIFGIAIGLVLLCLFAGIVTWSILKASGNEPEETKYDLFEPEMVSLDDIPDEVIDELTKPTGYIMTAEELKETMYKQDISESMPELAEKLEELPEEELDFVAAAPSDYEPEWPILDILLPEDLQIFTQEKCEEYDVDYRLILALMDTESSFRDDIGSEKVLGGTEGGARYYGYMQLSAANCESALKDGIDPHTRTGNIEAGIRYFGLLLHKYDSDPALAIAEYKGTNNPESDTVKKVLNKWDIYCEKCFLAECPDGPVYDDTDDEDGNFY